jgi:hypothetical protein
VRRPHHLFDPVFQFAGRRRRDEAGALRFTADARKDEGVIALTYANPPALTVRAVSVRATFTA